MTAAALALALALAAPGAARQAGAPADTVPEGNTAHAAAAEGTEAAAKNELRPVPLSPEQEKRARRLADRMKCPVCRSQSIRQSNSFMAEDMERKIRVLVAEGKTDEEIVDYFVSRFGEYILLAPPKRGFNLGAYVVPFLAVLAGGLGVLFATRRWKRAPAPAEEEPGEVLPEESPYLDRLERELKETE
ncbi:MAG: cytochrome c-type biogenesis protein [Gemmatimonadota bacterium]|nr:cytochrome c-type biogenesis protein [Gemmatimonadota bacterium]